MPTTTTRTIKEDTIKLLQRKRPLTYEGIVREVQARHPDCHTTVKTVQWYASRLRAAGEEVHVKLNTRAAKAPAVPPKGAEATAK